MWGIIQSLVQMSQSHQRHSPSHSVSLQALHTLPLPPALSAVVDHNPSFVLSLPEVFPFRSQGGAQKLSLVCFGVHSARSVLAVVPCQGQRGRWDPTFSTQGVLWMWCSIHPSCKIPVLGQGGLSPVNHKTSNDTPEQEDQFLPPGSFKPLSFS